MCKVRYWKVIQEAAHTQCLHGCMHGATHASSIHNYWWARCMAYNVSHCCCLHFPIVALSFLMQLQLCKWRIAGCARKFQISHQREVAHSHCLRFVQLAAGACRHKLGRYWSHHMQARQNFYVSINGGTLVTLNGGLLGVQNVDSILCPSRIGWASTLK